MDNNCYVISYNSFLVLDQKINDDADAWNHRSHDAVDFPAMAMSHLTKWLAGKYRKPKKDKKGFSYTKMYMYVAETRIASFNPTLAIIPNGDHHPRLAADFEATSRDQTEFHPLGSTIGMSWKIAVF